MNAETAAERVEELPDGQLGGRAVLANAAESRGRHDVHDQIMAGRRCRSMRWTRASHASDDRTHRLAAYARQVCANGIEEPGGEAQLGDFGAGEEPGRCFDGEILRLMVQERL